MSQGEREGRVPKIRWLEERGARKIDAIHGQKGFGFALMRGRGATEQDGLTRGTARAAI